LKRIGLFAGWTPFLLGILWLAIIGGVVVFGPHRQPRSPVMAQWLANAALCAPPLLVLLLAFWRNRSGFRLWSWPARIGNAALLGVQWVGWLVLYALVPIVLAPSYGDYTVRAKMSEVVLGMSAYRSDVTEAAAKAHTLKNSGVGVAFAPWRRIDAGFVGRDGVIAAYNAEYRSLVTLVPAMKDGQVAWSCQGFPPKFMPGSCRSGRSSYDDRASGSVQGDAAELQRLAEQLKRQPATEPQILPASGLLDFGYRDADGTIGLFSDRHGVFLLQDKTRCTVWPREAMLTGCEPGSRPLR